MRNFILITIFTISAISNPFVKKSNEICVAYPKQVSKLSFQQLCDYGKKGCRNIRKRDDIQGLCNEDKISECFSKKQWLTIEQYIHLDDNLTITKINTRTTMAVTNGSVKKTKQLCVETAKKTFTMSQEKFRLYKQLTPAVLDTINSATKDIITCIEKEISKKSLDECMQRIDKTPEETILGLIPSKVSLLCRKEKDDTIHFIWSREKHLLLIQELKNKIDENNQNKKCLLKSDTVQEYAACLAEKRR